MSASERGTGDSAGAGNTAPEAIAGQRPATGSEHRSDIDWEAAERSPEFKELIRKRRRFVLPGAS